MIYCRGCQKQKGLPVVAVGTSDLPCDICHGFDSAETHRKVGRPGVNMKLEKVTIKLKNLQYPDGLIDDALRGLARPYYEREEDVKKPGQPDPEFPDRSLA